MGDFNVTLKTSEHSAGGSFMSNDMLEFNKCVNSIEVEDICSSSFHFTWTKSLKNPNSSIMKKLDRMMINEEFIQQFWSAYGIFLPFVISDSKEWNGTTEILGCSYVQKKVVMKLQAKVEKNPFDKDLKINVASLLNDYMEATNDELKTLSQKLNLCMRFEGDNVANVFVEHFKKFLGTKHEVQPLESIEVDFDTVLNKEEANAMIGQVTDEEIKETVFDIDSNKASGPDGYTSGISKILTNRIKAGLQKVVNINQSAFNLGSHIQDNILIAQELLKEGKKFKFHYGCKDLKLSNMCFADDLLVLCNGDTESVQIIKNAMDQFSSVSGLFPNIGKSTIFFGSVPLDVQRDILTIMPFQVGKLPMKYLGVPLIAKKLGINDCKSLVNKVSEKINCWKNKVLSYAGRIQLIASVLSSMQIYWASVYMLPSSTINEIEKLLKGFLWCQGPLTSGKAKVAWKQVCLPKEQGGLGIKSLKKWNEVLLIKQLWKIIEGKESLWVKWVNVVKLKGSSIWDIEAKYNDSCGWKKLLELRNRIKAHVFYSIGDGRNVSMWFDKWDSNGPLCDIIPRREWYRERYNDKETVAQMINNGVWIWPIQWYSNYPILCNIAAPTLTEGTKDKVYWIDSYNVKKEFSTNQAWHDLRGNWHHVIWFSQFQPRHAFILWLATKERLATQDRIAKWNGQISTECPLCKKEKDSHEHLFFKCDYAEKIWYSLKVKMGRTHYNNELKSIKTSLSQTKANKNIGLNGFASNTLESSGHDCTFLVASFIQLGLGRKLDELVKEKRSSPGRCTIRNGLSLDIKGLGGWCINILYIVTGGLGGYN
ncbi:RNA-directed DNA polymerase, eukaryota, reverse transcriptase zinc-binding domain protein [Tanacetum coccineum]